MILAIGINTQHTNFYVQFKDHTMLKVTLSDYTVIYAETIGEAMTKAFKIGQDIRFIE